MHCLNKLEYPSTLTQSLGRHSISIFTQKRPLLGTVASMKSWLKLLMDLSRKKMEINLENTQRNTEIQRMTLLTEMSMVDSSMFIHTELLLMLENQVTPSFHRVLSVSQLIDLLLHFMLAQKEENYSLLVPCNSLVMNSLRKRTIRKSKKQFSNGL